MSPLRAVALLIFGLLAVENDQIAALQQSGRWALAGIINDVDRRPAAAILRRVGR